MNVPEKLRAAVFNALDNAEPCTTQDILNAIAPFMAKPDLENPPADAPLSVHLRGLARSMWPQDAIRPLLEKCADALEQSGK